MAVIPLALFSAFMRLAFSTIFISLRMVWAALRLMVILMMQPWFWAVVHLLAARQAAWLAWESDRFSGEAAQAMPVVALALIVTVFVHAGLVAKRIVRRREERAWLREQERLEAENREAWEQYYRDLAAWEQTQQQALAA